MKNRLSLSSPFLIKIVAFALLVSVAFSMMSTSATSGLSQIAPNNVDVNKFNTEEVTKYAEAEPLLIKEIQKRKRMTTHSAKTKANEIISKIEKGLDIYWALSLVVGFMFTAGVLSAISSLLRFWVKWYIKKNKSKLVSL